MPDWYIFEFQILYLVKNPFKVNFLPQGHHGIDKDVFISLPCVLGENGIKKALRLAQSYFFFLEKGQKVAESGNEVRKAKSCDSQYWHVI